MTIILCAIDDETGEILSLDGGRRSNIHAMKSNPDYCLFTPKYAGTLCAHCQKDEDDPVHKVAIPASKVDLSGCELKVPEIVHCFNEFDFGKLAAVQSILDQMPKGKK